MQEEIEARQKLGQLQFFYEIFEENVSKYPNLPALKIDHLDGSLTSHTYLEVNLYIKYIISQLKILELPKGTFVAVCMLPCLALYASILALWKMGYVYVPLSAHLSHDEMKYFINDSKVNIILTNESIFKQFQIQLQNLRHIFLTDTSADLTELKKISTIPLSQNTLDSRAYLIYTSGTTALPKGVLLKCSGIVNAWLTHQKKLNLKTNDRVIQMFDIRVDAHLIEMMLALGAGACLFASQTPTSKLIDKLAQIFAQQRITTAIMPPTLLQDLILKKDSDSFFKENFTTLIYLISATEELDDITANKWLCRGSHPNRRLFNGYGLTEQTIGVTLSEYFGGSVTIGTSSDIFIGMQVYLRRENGIISSITEDGYGELCAAGPGLAEGYWNDGKIDINKTGEFFPCLDAPNNSQIKLRMNRTGDFVQVKSGKIIYLKRIKNDTQVEIAGVRVELLSVVRKLEKNTAVKTAVVIKKGRRLIAFVVPKQTTHIPTAQELRACITNESLNNAEVPTCVYQISDAQIQDAQEGKLDCKTLLQLPLGVANTRECEHEYELRLKELWGLLLDYNNIPVTADFYISGGYSLLLKQLLGKVKNDFSMQNLFLDDLPHPLTIESMAIYLLGRQLYQNSILLLNESVKGFSNLPKIFYLYPLAGKCTKVYEQLALKIGDKFQHYAILSPLYSSTISKADFDYYMNHLPTSLSDIARAIVIAIRNIQPMGPYILCGYSFGGLLAFEIALQLRKAGQEISFLGLIDAKSPQLNEEMNLHEQRDRLAGILRAIASDFGCEEFVNGIESKLVQFTFKDQIIAAFDFINAKMVSVQNFSDNHKRFFIAMRISKQNLMATCDYFPRESVSNAKLYRADKIEHGLSFECTENAWKKWVKERGYQESVIPGASHFNIINNTNFVEQLKQDLIPYTVTQEWNLPPTNPNFVHRESIVKKIQHILWGPEFDQNSLTLFAFNGQGGVGKTDLVNYLIHQREQYFTLRAWFPADSFGQLIAAYMDFAYHFKISYSHNVKSCIAEVKKWFETHTGWLLVYDNAQNSVELEEFLPRCGGKIIITSRNPNWEGHKIEIGLMESAEAEQLVKRLLGDIPGIPDLVKELSLSPLLVRQACKYIRQCAIPIKDFLLLLQVAPQTLPYILPEDKEKKHLAIIIRSSLEALSKDFEAIFIVKLCAFLHPDCIPRSFIFRAIAHKINNAVDQAKINASIAYIRSFEIIQFNPEKSSYSMHRMVQDIIRSTLDRQWSQIFMSWAAMTVHNEYHSITSFSGSIATIPHLEIVAKHCKELRAVNLSLNPALSSQASFLNPAENFINILRDLANAYGIAFSHKEKANEFLKEALGIVYLRFHELKHLLPILLDELAVYCDDSYEGLLQRKSLQQKALELENQLNHGGSFDMDIAVTMHQLGMTYMFLNDTESAINHLKSALDIKERLKGRNSFRAHNTLLNLASCYKARNDFEEANNYFERAKQAALAGNDNNKLGYTLLTEAAMFLENKNYSGAYGQLKQCEKLFKDGGEDDPRMAYVLYARLAECAAALYLPDEESHYIAIAFKWMRIYSNHEPVQIAELIIKCAEKYAENNHPQLAISKYELGIKELIPHLGEMHPDVISAQYELGKLYQLSADTFEVGKKTCEQAEQNLKKLLLTEHHSRVIYHLDKFELINAVEKQQLEMQSKPHDRAYRSVMIKRKPHKEEASISSSFDPEISEKIALQQGKLAKEAYDKRDYQTAINHYNVALEILQKTYGKYHDLVASTYFNLASVNMKIKNYYLAISLYLIAIDIDEKIYGMLHAVTAKHYYKLGCAYLIKDAGISQKAFKYLNEALFCLFLTPGDHTLILNEIMQIFKTNPIVDINAEIDISLGSSTDEATNERTEELQLPNLSGALRNILLAPRNTVTGLSSPVPENINQAPNSSSERKQLP